MTEFDVVNVVGTVDFQRCIALSPLADSLVEHDGVSQVEYDPSELHLIHSWFSEDDVYVAFYKNGMCSITGASSLDRFYDVSDAVRDVVEDIVDFEIEATVNLSNIVSTADIENLPSLEAIAIGLGLERTEYEPEQFPALIYRGDSSVILIFSSGKIVCTGLTDLDAVSEAINDIADQIQAVT